MPAKKDTKSKSGNTKKTSGGPKGRKLTKKQLDNFKELLVTKRRILEGDVGAMEMNALRGSSSEGGESHMPLHLADLGTDNYEQDFTLGLIESEEEEIRQINEALERIEEGAFGICENCETAIPVERLKAKPHARLCISCQEEYEEQQAAGGEPY